MSQILIKTKRSDDLTFNMFWFISLWNSSQLFMLLFFYILVRQDYIYCYWLTGHKALKKYNKIFLPIFSSPSNRRRGISSAWRGSDSRRVSPSVVGVRLGRDAGPRGTPIPQPADTGAMKHGRNRLRDPTQVLLFNRQRLTSIWLFISCFELDAIFVN